MPISLKHTKDAKEDAGLMLRISKGDEHAFAILVQKHLEKTVRMSIRIVGNRADAEDVAQDAFIRVWKNAEKWKPPEAGGAKFTTWFYRVVTNLCIDYTRKKKAVSIENVAEPESDEINSQERLENEDRYIIVKKYVDDLPTRQSIALTLCFYEDMSNKEASEVMDISVKALESLLVRARRTLKDKMKNKRNLLNNG